jgi:cytochrome c oxidase assembly factor CtaG/glycerophosphoryl diester phosphodiesterase
MTAGVHYALGVDWLFLAGFVGAVYTVALLRSKSAVAHPLYRWLAFSGGLAVLLIAYDTPLDAYDNVSFVAHTGQHLLLLFVVAPLIALGAPVSVALAAAPGWIRDRLLVPLLRNRLVSSFARPAVALALFATVQTATQFTPFFNAALNNGWPHVLEHAMYLVTGFLFWWTILGVDAAPRRAASRARLAALLMAIPLEAGLGLAILLAGAPLYAHYASLPPPWGPDALASQRQAGLLLWLGGDALIAAVAVLTFSKAVRLQREPRGFGALALSSTVSSDATAERDIGARARSRSVETVLHRVNTPARLRLALDAQIDRIEIDVRHIRGELVLCHDVPVGRWTVGRNGVEFSSGSRLPVRRHGPLLKLPDVLEMRPVPLFIDLKGRWPNRALAQLVDLLERFERTRDVIASNSLGTLERIRAMSPGCHTVYGVPKRGLPSLLEGPPTTDVLFGASLDATDPACTEISIERLHVAGLFVYAWNIRSRGRLDELSGAGIDGMIVDDSTWARR